MFEKIMAALEKHFNPRSPWGERPHALRVSLGLWRISIHAPRGGSDSCWYSSPARIVYFNPRSPWGERLRYPLQVLPAGAISIHAPRGGSDPPWETSKNMIQEISIHAPRGGSDVDKSVGHKPKKNFNPRSPWGERHHPPQVRPLPPISIHAPRGGSDVDTGYEKTSVIFQSTLPVGGATRSGRPLEDAFNFNPRSPWGERLPVRRETNCMS